MSKMNRYLGNPVLSATGRFFFRSPIGDFHCGLRGFSKAAILALDLRTTGMEFASEMVVKATLTKMRIAEVPTILYPDGRSHPSHLRRWRDGWRHLRFLLLYSPRWLFLYPGILLMLVGFAAGLWLISGPRTIGGITFDIHTLLYASMAVIIGFQSIAFSVLSKVYAVSEGLIPDDPRVSKALRVFAPEVGLVIGTILFVIGLAGSIFAFRVWGLQSFGPLDPQTTMRAVIPAGVLVALGVQTILSSFFLGLLGMARR